MSYTKNGIVEEVKATKRKKYGGMVYLWLNNPFSNINRYLSNQNYKFSAFLEQYILNHRVYEMPINDMWDIDTPEVVSLTEEKLKEWGGWDVSIK